MRSCSPKTPPDRLISPARRKQASPTPSTQTSGAKAPRPEGDISGPAVHQHLRSLSPPAETASSKPTRGGVLTGIGAFGNVFLSGEPRKRETREIDIYIPYLYSQFLGAPTFSPSILSLIQKRQERPSSPTVVPSPPGITYSQTHLPCLIAGQASSLKESIHSIVASTLSLRLSAWDLDPVSPPPPSFAYPNVIHYFFTLPHRYVPPSPRYPTWPKPNTAHHHRSPRCRSTSAGPAR